GRAPGPGRSPRPTRRGEAPASGGSSPRTGSRAGSPRPPERRSPPRARARSRPRPARGIAGFLRTRRDVEWPAPRGDQPSSAEFTFALSRPVALNYDAMADNGDRTCADWLRLITSLPGIAGQEAPAAREIMKAFRGVADR